MTKGVLGSARGLTSSDALICCQVLVLILMADETDPARGLSFEVDDESVVDDYDEVAL